MPCNTHIRCTVITETCISINIQPEQKINYLKGIVVTSRFSSIQADTDPLKVVTDQITASPAA